MHKPIVTYEFGTLYIEGQAHFEGDTPLKEVTFDNLWDFILSNEAGNDSDVVMSAHTRGGKRYIKTGRFVGTIQTRDGQVIEILPKIYKASGRQEEDQTVCRKVFLNMLQHFTDAKPKSFQQASLSTQKGFPILEAYVANYIQAVEHLILGRVRKDYSKIEGRESFLKGRLNVVRQIAATNKALFDISYNKFIEDIPQNRIVVTTLRKLLDVSHSTTNKTRISSLLTLLGEIPSSSHIAADLKASTTTNRLFSGYEMLMMWSSQFLLNKGFTTFSGEYVNLSLLFQAERLFEDFVAYLFKKYAPTYHVDAQNSRYFLVDRHNGKGMFRLRPDILVESGSGSPHHDCIIIDTKWKAIDGSKPDRYYLIDIKDMYQLYAYGQKYRLGISTEQGMDVVPKLVLLYPYSHSFTEKLPEFVYEDIRKKFGLRLMVVPFDLTASIPYEEQVHNIIHCLDVTAETQPVFQYEYNETEETLPCAAENLTLYRGRESSTLLVGCYKDEAHLEWIRKHRLYNIRIGNRDGAIDRSGVAVSASRLLLYNYRNPMEYAIYSLDSTKQILASNEMMVSKGYPGIQPNREYLLYLLGDEVKSQQKYDVAELKEKYAPRLKEGAPFFVTL